MNPRAVIWAAVSTAPQATDDKDSIPTQLEQGRALAAHEGWDVVAELVVPGHSRYYYDFHELARDARTAKTPIPAFDELLSLWESSGFDILIVRDGTRFARSQSLHAYFVERTIDIDARIYSFADGMIDDKNAAMFHSMSSYKSVSERQALVQRRKWGMNKLAELGFPTGRIPVFTHRVIRNQIGKRQAVEIKAEVKPLLDDLEKILLAGTPWYSVESELFKLGHCTASGRPYPPRKFYYLLQNPYFWGNSGINYKKYYGLWAFDPDEPVPPGATIYRNTHEPAYVGEQASRIQAELRRRADIIKGNAKPTNTYWFSGLFVCSECKYKLAAQAHYKTKAIVSLRCGYRYRSQHQCSQGKTIHERTLRKYVDSWLRQLLEASDIEAFFAAGDEDQAANLFRLRAKEKQIEELLLDIGFLIDDRRSARTDEVRQLYGRKVSAAEAQLEMLKTEVLFLRNRTELEDRSVYRQISLADIRQIGIDQFWELPSRQINQILHNLLDIWRFRTLNGEVTGRIKYRRNMNRS